MTTPTIDQLQAALEKANAAVDAANASIAKLEGKNSELIDREKTERARAEAAEKQLEDAEENAGASTELAKLQRAHTKLERALETMTAERDTLSGDLRTIRVDNEVKTALVANKVKPELQPAVEALLLRQATYEDGLATINGKPIADAAKAFFTSKEGSYFVSAPESTGSGSTGTANVAASRFAKAPETAQEYNDFMKFSSTNKAEANALATQWERKDLIS